MIIIGALWAIAIIAIIVVYFAYNFTQYKDTVPPETIASNETVLVPSEPIAFSLGSSAFTEGESIPALHTCDESQAPVPLTFFGVPEGAQSLALIMEDRDIPKNIVADGTFLHWVVYDISPENTDILSGEVFGTEGANGLGRIGYMGPCAPRNQEPTEHRYYFTLYALDVELAAAAGLDKAGLLAAMEGHIVQTTELMGRYERREK